MEDSSVCEEAGTAEGAGAGWEPEQEEKEATEEDGEDGEGGGGGGRMVGGMVVGGW